MIFVEIRPFPSPDKSPRISTKLNLNFGWNYLPKTIYVSNLTNHYSDALDRLADQRQCIYIHTNYFDDILSPTNFQKITSKSRVEFLYFILYYNV